MENIFSNIYNAGKKTLKNKWNQEIMNYTPPGYYTSQKANTGNTAGNVGSNTIDYSKYMSKAPTYDYSSWVSKAPAQTAQPAPAIKPSQPTNTGQTAYDTNYSNYLTNRSNTAMTLAEKQKAAQDAADKQAYDYARQGLLEQQGNLSSALGTYRTRSAEDIARLKATGERTKETAITQSGASQRALAETRRQALGDIEKRYANLGTIDSYGTGSFTQANTNEETGFLKMTNENMQNLNDKLYEIDDNIQNFELEATRKIQDQEAQYNQAVQQINSQLANNEELRGQALQQAALLLEQKKAEINDEYQQLTLSAQQQKQAAQAEIDKLTQQDAYFQQVFQGASQTFLDTGKPATMNDFMIMNKYPDAYKSMLEFAKSGGGSNTASQAKQNIIQTIDDVLNSGNIGRLTGMYSYVPRLRGNKANLTQSQIDQLKNMLSLQNRTLLKGTGTISDYEAKMLEKAASALAGDLSEEQFIQVLNQLKTELSSGARPSINAPLMSLASQYGF